MPSSGRRRPKGADEGLSEPRQDDAKYGMRISLIRLHIRITTFPKGRLWAEKGHPENRVADELCLFKTDSTIGANNLFCRHFTVPIHTKV